MGRDDVELWVAGKRVDGGLCGADPGPVRVDVAGETPAAVGRPDEGRRGYRLAVTEVGLPGVDVVQRTA
ncbi:hypothetical protein [Micromonospora citrea]|uniref:hypothetical protein n=1 Tax=Micromonospora citrea TaxID=47855 RepID=UPI00159F1DEC|nr:hypothetical protein [Micromonospora citrea]